MEGRPPFLAGERLMHQFEGIFLQTNTLNIPAQDQEGGLPLKDSSTSSLFQGSLLITNYRLCFAFHYQGGEITPGTRGPSSKRSYSTGIPLQEDLEESESCLSAPWGCIAHLETKRKDEAEWIAVQCKDFRSFLLRPPSSISASSASATMAGDAAATTTTENSSSAKDLLKLLRKWAFPSKLSAAFAFASKEVFSVLEEERETGHHRKKKKEKKKQKKRKQGTATEQLGGTVDHTKPRPKSKTKTKAEESGVADEEEDGRHKEEKGKDKEKGRLKTKLLAVTRNAKDKPTAERGAAPGGSGKEEDGVWSVFGWEKEMKRQGIELWEGGEWKLSDVNQGYKLCECYPSLLVVPQDSEEEELRAVARVRRLARLPALTWKSQERLTCPEFARQDENATEHQEQQISKACLLRGADLNANTIEDTVFGKVAGNELDYEEDERYLLKMLDLNPASPSLHIIDSSSALAMMPAEGLLPDSNAPNSLNSSTTASALTAAINVAASNGAAGHGTAGEGGGGTELVKMTANDESNTMGAAAAAAEGSIIIGGDKLNAMRGITIEAATKESLLKLKHLCTTSTPFFFSRKAAVNTKTKNEDRQVQHFRIRTRTRTRISRQRRPSRAADDDSANEDDDHSEVENAGGDSRLAGLLDSKQAWQQALRASGWLKQIRALFNLALEMMAHLLEDAQQDPPKPPETVLAQSMLGVDSTAQLVSLVQLCSDPYYRTFEGFAVLIEKDWESFGHSFGQKVTKRYDSEQMSSTFVQFLDCVWQLMNQFPCAFEFSEMYLLFLLRSLYSRRFATFLYDNEKERYADRRKYKRGLPCIWKYSLSAGRQKAYGNPFFGQAGDDPSKPLIPRPSAVTLWQGYYLRWTCKEQVLAAIQKTERCQQTLTAELDLSFASLPISPDRLQHLTHLTQLDLSGNHLTSFPITLTSLRRLKKLSLAYNAISILPTSLLQAYARPDVESAQLEELDLGQNTIVSFPWCGWENLPCLTSLKLNNNKISGQLPPSISSLSCLQCLCLQNNNIELLPRSIVKLTSLTHLDLGKNKLGKLPGHLFRKLTNLKHLCLAKNNLTQLPRGLKFLKRLHTFDLSHNSGLCIDEGPEEKKTGTYPPYSVYLSKENNRTPALFELFELGCTLKELNLAGLRFGHLYSTMNKLYHKDPFRSSESMIIATKQGHATQIETFIDGLWSELKVLEVLNLRETGITMKHSFHRSQGNLKRSNIHQQHRHRHKGRKSKSNDNRLPQSDMAVLDDKREEDFPWGIFAISTLQKLYLGNNHILELPDLVQNLPNLVLLDLCSTRLKHVSPRIGHLLKLSTLHLCHNKDLQELPSQLGFLVQLERLKLPNHKYFTFPPSDVVAMGKSSVISWLQQAFQGTQRCYRMKLMLVGQENVGKTSVLKCLSSSSHKYKLKKQQLAPSRTTTVSTTEEPSMVATPATPAGAGANLISEGHSVIATSAEFASHELKSGDGTSLQENALGPNTISTDGIDIAEWSISVPIQHKDGTAEKQGVVLSAWDFAGQELYYSTHQFFLSERSLYLLVWNLARPEEDSRVEYWLYSIAARAPEAAVIMVGTHLDSPICGEEQYTANVLKKLLAKYKSKFPSIQGIHFVSCANGKGLEELKADIADTVSKQRWIGEEMPNTYVELEKMVKNNHKRPPIAFWSEFLTMAGLCGIKDEMAVRVAASHLHNLGSLLYFGEDPRLSDIVIMNPQWLTEVMSSIITTKHNYGKKDGILQHSSLPFIWREPDYPASVYPFLLTLLEKFEVAFNMGAKTSQDLNQGFSLIPALLSAQSKPPESLLTQLWPPITSLMRPHRGHLIQDRTASLGLMGLRSLMLHAAGGSGSGGTLIHPHADIGGTYVLGGDKSKWAFLNALTAEALDQMEENEFSRYYLFQFVPEGFFSRLMVRLLAFNLTAKEYWKNGLLVTKGEEKIFMELMDNCFLSPSSSSGATMGTSSGSLSPFIDLAMLQFPPDKNKEAIALHNATKILRLVVRTKLSGDNLHTLYSSIIEMVDSLISDWYKLRVSVYAPCIRCILNQAYFQDIYGQRSATATLRGDFSNVLAGIYMFRIETCKAMALEGKPFLYCPACFSKGWHHAQGEGGLVRLDKIAPDLALVQLQKFKVDYEKDLMIEELIGEGGYAYVYKATYKGEPVAVKRLKTKEESGMLGEEAENARLDAFTEFRREVWVMSGLDHPNIVPLRGFSLEPCCIVTEFMQHGSLYSYLHDEKSASLSWALRFKIAKDIAKGCAFLHGCSPPVLHRDLKSPNILLCSLADGSSVVAKVADFGTSQSIAHTSQGRVVDNPVWLAPEVIQNREYSTAADVYSFGVIMWELLTRQDFFGEITFLSQMEDMIMSGQRPPIPPLPDDSSCLSFFATTASKPRKSEDKTKEKEEKDRGKERETKQVEALAPCWKGYTELLKRCWEGTAEQRPTFAECVATLDELMRTCFEEKVWSYDANLLESAEQIEQRMLQAQNSDTEAFLSQARAAEEQTKKRKEKEWKDFFNLAKLDRRRAASTPPNVRPFPRSHPKTQGRIGGKAEGDEESERPSKGKARIAEEAIVGNSKE